MTLDLNKAYIYNFKARNSMVGLVQLVRALVCGTRNHGFESHARVFDSRIRRSESCHPSHTVH